LEDAGIPALVNEATEFQADRARGNLAKILQAIEAEKLLNWAKILQAELYEELFRLCKLKRRDLGIPPVLDPAIRDESRNTQRMII